MMGNQKAQWRKKKDGKPYGEFENYHYKKIITTWEVNQTNEIKNKKVQ